MGIDTHQYTEFKRLSLRIIKPALEELSTIGGYKVEVAYQRVNRKITALKFYFKAKQTVQTVKRTTQLTQNSALQSKLMKDYGLSSRQSQNIISLYPLPYIQESLAIIKHKISQKVVKNIPAYTITVLKNDYTALSNLKESSSKNTKNQNRNLLL